MKFIIEKEEKNKFQHHSKNAVLRYDHSRAISKIAKLAEIVF